MSSELNCILRHIESSKNPCFCPSAAERKGRSAGNTLAIAEFADKFGIGEKQAYNYLSRFKGLAHLFTFYDVIHTLSFEDAIDTMVQVCSHNGGGLR